jgi:hypothetical protein
MRLAIKLFRKIQKRHPYHGVKRPARPAVFPEYRNHERAIMVGNSIVEWIRNNVFQIRIKILPSLSFRIRIGIRVRPDKGREGLVKLAS